MQKPSRLVSHVVNSHNGWDPLEEVIVGRLDNPKVPPLSSEFRGHLPENKWDFYEKNGGKDFPLEHVKKAQEEVENLCFILEREGVKVRRPDKVVAEKGFATPEFSSSITHFNNNPRY